jgi:hypothetical protein
LVNYNPIQRSIRFTQVDITFHSRYCTASASATSGYISYSTNLIHCHSSLSLSLPLGHIHRLYCTVQHLHQQPLQDRKSVITRYVLFVLYMLLLENQLMLYPPFQQPYLLSALSTISINYNTNNPTFTILHKHLDHISTTTTSFHHTTDARDFLFLLSPVPPYHPLIRV